MRWSFIFHRWAKKSNQNITNVMSFQLLFLIKKAAKLLVVWTAQRAADKSASSTFGGNGEPPHSRIVCCKNVDIFGTNNSLAKKKKCTTL